ncbi:MAG: methyltransferase domain-containing protein [Chloroflexia bacterium]
MTDEQPRPSSHSSFSGGSASWQPDDTVEHQAARSAYLERIYRTPLLQEILARTLDVLALASGQSVLEVGCGSGLILPVFAREVGPTGRVVGLDHAPAFVAEARARVAAEGLAESVTVEEGDAYHLPYPTASFDAAHCERVLMHLTDPTAALREMARVVRPGGIVVAVEPDWLGIRIDHPEHADFAPIYRRALNFRHPDIGLTLYRRLADAGLVERQAVLVPSTITNHAVLRAYGLDLAPAAEALIVEGSLTRERAETLLAYLETASQNGTFYSYGCFHIVSGRVPPLPI